MNQDWILPNKEVEPTLIVVSRFKSRLNVFPGLVFSFTKGRPNWFWRFMQRILLGWTWETINGDHQWK